MAMASSLEEENKVLDDLLNARTLNDLLQLMKDRDIVNILDTITFNVEAQKVIFQIQKLLKQESEERLGHIKFAADTHDEGIARLSDKYTNKYHELLEFFREWKPSRENLIECLKKSSKSIERSNTFTSVFRIITSAVDILGTFARSGGEPAFSWADFAMKYASQLGLIAVFLKITYSKKKQNQVKKAMNGDQENFKKIVRWLKETELDKAIKNYFPYGIDPEIVKNINDSPTNFDEEEKIFMSIFASNVKRNVRLFKNKEFLGKAEKIATSDAGKQWFNRIVLQNDPGFQHYLNTQLCDEIQEILKNPPVKKEHALLEAGANVIPSQVQAKITLNAITMILEANNLFFDTKPEVSETFEKLSETTRTELEEITNVVRLLRPSNFPLDPILRS